MKILTFQYQLLHNIKLKNFLDIHQNYYCIVENYYTKMYNAIRNNGYQNIKVIDYLSMSIILKKILGAIL